MAGPPILRHVAGTTQTIAVSGTSAQSAAFSGASGYIRVVATTFCHVRSGTNPTATTSNMPICPYVPEYFAIGLGEKLAVIQNSAAGTLYITEMSL
jgi:hypothetical protein